jgi:crotonobetainyl-CoA:carnitine CoA-transferase CaiB-like acyl-CoA transferase
MIYNDKHWQSFFKELGNPDWSQDPMFENMRSRTQNIGAVLARVAAVLETRTTEEWMTIFRHAEIPATPIASLTDLLHDPHLEQTGFWEDRHTEAGHLRFPGIPTSFSETPGEIGDPGPVLGAHSRAVLTEAGFAASEIDAMLASGALVE